MGQLSTLLDDDGRTRYPSRVFRSRFRERQRGRVLATWLSLLTSGSGLLLAARVMPTTLAAGRLLLADERGSVLGTGRDRSCFWSQAGARSVPERYASVAI